MLLSALTRQLLGDCIFLSLRYIGIEVTGLHRKTQFSHQRNDVGFLYFPETMSRPPNCSPLYPCSLLAGSSNLDRKNSLLSNKYIESQCGGQEG